MGFWLMLGPPLPWLYEQSYHEQEIENKNSTPIACAIIFLEVNLNIFNLVNVALLNSAGNQGAIKTFGLDLRAI